MDCIPFAQLSARDGVHHAPLIAHHVRLKPRRYIAAEHIRRWQRSGRAAARGEGWMDRRRVAGKSQGERSARERESPGREGELCVPLLLSSPLLSLLFCVCTGIPNQPCVLSVLAVPFFSRTRSTLAGKPRMQTDIIMLNRCEGSNLCWCSSVGPESRALGKGSVKTCLRYWAHQSCGSHSEHGIGCTKIDFIICAP